MTRRLLRVLCVVALVSVAVAGCGTTKPASTTTRPASTTTRPASTTTRPASTTTRPASGELTGVFMITGGGCLPNGCEDAMSGVVTLTGANGVVHQIDVNANHPLETGLEHGRFTLSLRSGRYRISDTVSKARGGGTCPVFLTTEAQTIDSRHPVSAVSVGPHKRTYVRVNCFGH
jgi:hypothetical protein